MAEQLDQGENGAQDVGAPLLQLSACVSGPSHTPTHPRQTRERARVPGPHREEHGAHGPHSPGALGGPAEHAVDSLASPLQVPTHPVQLRVRVFVPWPHAVEQLP